MIKFVPGNPKIASTAKTRGRKLNTTNMLNLVEPGLNLALYVIKISCLKTSSSIVVAAKDVDRKEQKYRKIR